MNENVILIDDWSDVGIDHRPGVNQTKQKCPACGGDRKNKGDKSLSVNFSLGIANCHRTACGKIYKVKKTESYQEKPKVYKYPTFETLPISEKHIEFFNKRGIERRTLEYFKISDAVEWMYAKEVEHEGKQVVIKEGKTDCIAFNYYFGGKHTNTKFRASQKRFRLVSNAMLTFYGIDYIKDKTWCAIQEGEIDTLSAYQCGVYSSVSVPNGASTGNQQLEYLDNCIEYFENKDKIIIATDDDLAGRALSIELIRRLGAEKCYTIEYPEGCKDTNEVLIKYGPDAVKQMYDNAKPVPITGVAPEDDVRNLINDLYENGYPQTCKIGYPEFDELLSFKPGELTLCTGIPSMGKTTFLDQVLVRLSSRHEWKTLIFSPENSLAIQSHKIIQKFMGLPTIGYNKISREKLDRGTDFLVEHFYFMKHDEMETDINSILAKAKEMVKRKGINALVIDPWNCIEHLYGFGQSETQYISQVLTKLTSFAKVNHIHIFLVAHPVKMDKAKDEKGKYTDKYEVPTPYKISGSANWYNKTDNAIAVHIDYATGIVEVHVQKVKFDYVGKKGVALFIYDKPTGRYAEYGGVANWEPEYNVYQEILKKRLSSTDQELPFHYEPEKVIREEREPGQLKDINSLLNAYEPPF